MTVATVGYPFMVYWGISSDNLTFVATFMITLLGVRVGSLIYQTRRFQKRLQYSDLLPPLFGGAVIASALIYQDIRGFLYYPVVVNIALLAIFSLSIYCGKPIITRLAQMTTSLDDEGRHYTRRLTQIWSLFFAFNGAVALFTTHLSIDVWTLYNGAVSYCLIGGLAGGEWIYRKTVLGR
ncbi:septation protein IspZ [Vibrio agarivorans]|uniref:septation protein IspZ n=1 Tax=Vibrio agarivorans TaxID=153622 RepID=UPI00222E2CAA|nr:septation protein IspZ [Vibrio agarivorans]